MHEGHRNRVRKKFIANGLENFEDHEILELALFYAIPRKDTNEIAHKLIDHCGSLTAVFDASIKVLAEVKGISESAAIFIKLIPNLSRVYMERKFMHDNKNMDVKNFCDKLSLKFIGRMEEAVAIALLDAKGKLVYEGIVSKGTVNAVDIYARRIIELIVHYSACSVILAHNHPSGFAIPSIDDIESTTKLNKIFSSMKVSFLDHIIVADGDYVSLRDCGIEDAFGRSNDNN